MQEVIIHNISQPQVPIFKARYCSSFLCRLRGLTFCREIQPYRGLLLVQPRQSRIDASIHMLFVWMNLVIVWIDASEEVIDVRLARSWHPIYIPKKAATYVLELNEKYLDSFKVGDQIYIEKTLG